MTRSADGLARWVRSERPHSSGSLDLLDWRRQVAELYVRIRAEPDPLRAWNDWRETRARLFDGHAESPLAGAAGVLEAGEGAPSDDARPAQPSYFAYDPAWRFAAETTPLEDGERLMLALGEDGTTKLTAFARTNGLAARLGRELTLYWIEGYGGGCFLPFRDETAGGESYAGGRYLLDTIKGADLGTDRAGRLILDFNFAYNPSCAYSTRWTCPLPPAANHVSAPIRAGERRK